MFTDLFLDPRKLNKDERREKIKNLSYGNLIFKNKFTGFNYSILNKKHLFEEKNKNYFKKYINDIKIPIYEVLSYEVLTKFYLDCEMEELTVDEYNKKDDLFIKFDKYLLDFLDKKFPQKEKNILYADSSRLKNNKYKISIHVVVNNLGYFKRDYLKKIVLEFINTLPKDDFYRNGKSFVDSEVYHGSQLIRIIYSPNNQPDSKLIPFIIYNNKIIYKDIEYISNNYNNSLCGNYYNLDNIKNDIYEDTDENINKRPKKINQILDSNLEEQNKEIPNWKLNWIKNNNYVKNIYEIDNIFKNKVNLRRIDYNAYCKLCKRNHENDNAMCIVYENNIMFYCNRYKNGGISIGSWYNKENINEINLNNLKEENLNLKNKIKELEEIINNLKTINKCIPHKNTTHKNLNKNNNNNIFEKYYESGKLLINNKVDEFNNIISQYWKDKNLSKIKNRCLRVYYLFEFMKENNSSELKMSLRSIFNLSNWKFDEQLKNKLFFK
jgi:hypothetical protein